jgi:hypothetical protein
VDPKYEGYITSFQKEEFRMGDMHELIKTAIIDISNKMILKFDSNSQEQRGPILYGECNLHRD